MAEDRMEEERKLVQVWLPLSLIKALDHYRIERRLFRQDAVAELLQAALKDAAAA